MITPSTLKGLLYQRINQGTEDEEVWLVDPGTGLGDRAKAAAVNKMTHPPFWVRLPEDDPYRTSNFLFQGEDGSIWDFKVGWEEWRKR